MTIAIDHPLLRLLTAAVDGGSTGGVTVLPGQPGCCAAAIGLRGGAVVSADVSPSWVRGLLPPWPDDADEHHPALSPPFLVALARRLGAAPSGLSTLLGTPGSAAVAAAGHFAPLAGGPLTWSDYRTDVRTYRYCGTAVPSASISVGRGPGGRWDAWVDVDPANTPRCGHPAAGELLDAVKVLTPPGVPVFASVPAHSARALELIMTVGFRPIGAEVLFAFEDQPPATNRANRARPRRRHRAPAPP